MRFRPNSGTMLLCFRRLRILKIKIVAGLPLDIDRRQYFALVIELLNNFLGDSFSPPKVPVVNVIQGIEAIQMSRFSSKNIEMICMLAK